MKQRGVTIVELLITIVVMAIIASISIITVGNIIRNAREDVDEYNQQFLVDTLEDMFLDGTIEMKGNNIYHPESGKSFSGTGRVFYRELEGYFGNRIFPLVEEAQNNYNKTGDGIWRYRFRQKNGDLEIYYFNDDKDVVIVATVDIP